MLDIKYIRDHAKVVKKAAKNKLLNPKVVDEVLRLDKQRRQLIHQVEQIRSEKNKLTKKDRLKGKALKQKLKDIEPQLKKTEAAYSELMLQIPGVPAEEVPIGADEKASKVVRTWGKKPKFSFKPKDHITLGKELELLDLERGVKVSGYRGYFLKNQAVQYQLGLMRYALDKLVDKGFSPIIPPIIVKSRALINSGHFPWGKVDVYKTFDDKDEQDRRFLAGTAEVSLVSYHQDEILSQKDLPLLYAGFSPCYRREIGSYGKDTKGIYRIHEFFKIEQVVICKAELKESLKWHQKLAAYSEEMLQELELPYQVLLMPSGDMGEPQYKKYDIETWMPSRKNYGETMSDSIMLDFQSRRANIKYRAKDGLKYVHMLNNTAIASPRILIALWENHQQADGSIKIPKVLHKYVGFKVIKKP